jgi:hypothetical protein
MIRAGVSLYRDWEERFAWPENTPALDHQVDELVRGLAAIMAAGRRLP